MTRPRLLLLAVLLLACKEEHERVTAWPPDSPCKDVLLTFGFREAAVCPHVQHELILHHGKRLFAIDVGISALHWLGRDDVSAACAIRLQGWLDSYETRMPDWLAADILHVLRAAQEAT